MGAGEPPQGAASGTVVAVVELDGNVEVVVDAGIVVRSADELLVVSACSAGADVHPEATMASESPTTTITERILFLPLRYSQRSRNVTA